METVAWMVGREGGVTELLFDAPEPPYVLVKELVFRVDAEAAVGKQMEQLIDTQYQLISRNAEYSHALMREFQRGQEISALEAKIARLEEVGIGRTRAKIYNEMAERVEALQAKLDAVMLEHCPDEMTAEQKATWAQHQVPAPNLVLAICTAYSQGFGHGECSMTRDNPYAPHDYAGATPEAWLKGFDDAREWVASQIKDAA